MEGLAFTSNYAENVDVRSESEGYEGFFDKTSFGG
jgi:hypothetical protein